MTWTLIMLTIAFGLALSGVSGWLQERRREARNAEPIPARQPEGESAETARPMHHAVKHRIYADARS